MPRSDPCPFQTWSDKNCSKSQAEPVGMCKDAKVHVHPLKLSGNL